MPLLETKGAGSAQGFGLSLGAAVIPNYIEEVFSTYLYTGNGSTQTITNGIDLAGEGGLVWIKDRNSGAKGHALFDTARGVNKKLQSQSTNGEFSSPNQLTAFNSTGFDLGSAGDPNGSGTTYVSWTFRKQPKFFDVVTYTGTGSNQSIAHNLGSAPGCIIVKTLGSGYDWNTWHRSGTQLNSYSLALNSTRAYQNTGDDLWGTVGGVPNMNSATFSVGSYGAVNASGQTYVAYIFAHDAGGFGLTGTDNVISCGTYTTDGSGNATVTLGYEPQFLLRKRNVAGSTDWIIADAARGWTTSGVAGTQILQPNDSSAESVGNNIACSPSATGMTIANDGASRTYIYIAIRRGPMKVPTSGTSVYNAIARTGTGAAATVTGAGFPLDLMISHSRNVGTNNVASNDRLRGAPQTVNTNTTGAEFTSSTLLSLDQDGFSVSSVASGPYNSSGETNVNWLFRRAPNFFDEVCYTGNSVSGTTQAHNLGVVPELRIVKSRTSADNWMVTGTFTTSGKFLNLESTDPIVNYGAAWRVDANAAVLTLGSASQVNSSGNTYVAYLFATLAGVSKVGSYTGNGSSQTINCGFTGGARFVMIKRTDSTGDWYVWDSARGIVAGNDPHLSLNSTTAEVTTDDSVDTDSTGFVVNQVAATNVNVNTATYIFLAIA
jgi:hypothetical protein